MRLRPGKYLKLRNMHFVVGNAYEDAGKFTLLNNIQYKPLDIEPYDQFTNTGTRVIEKNCSKFLIKFTTCGNITPKNVMNKLVDTIKKQLLDIKAKVELFSKTASLIYYNMDGCEVTILDNLYTYKFINHYYTPINMIAMQCYTLDENVLYCASAVERYDTQVGIIRIKHANPNDLILKSIDKCLTNLQILHDKF